MSKSITYSSTRGSQKSLSFRHAVMTGLAHDRGLFVPDSFPTVAPDELESWRSLSYHELATEVIGKYVKEDEVPRKVLADIVKRSCGAFRSGEVTPLVKVDGHYVLVSYIYSVCSFVELSLDIHITTYICKNSLI
jgi:threonine synthase